MEYWAIVLILGLFHTAPSVDCAEGPDSGNDGEVITKNISDKLEQMEKKMEKIETLLYKVLIATESIQNHADGTCLPTEYFERTRECINLGDVMCTSIDLLENKTVCYECVSCSDNTVVSCKHYGNLTKPLMVPNIRVNISNAPTDSNILDFKIDSIKKDFVVKVTGCTKCIKSQYNYTYIFKKPHVQAYAEYPLRCKCDNVEHQELYCREWDPPSCYIKTTNCLWNANALYCNVSKYGDSETITYVDVIINGLKPKCQRWKEVSGCSFSVTFDDNSLDIIHNKKHLEWTENLKINVSCPRNEKDPCTAPFHNTCNESFSNEHCIIIEPAEPLSDNVASGSGSTESDSTGTESGRNKEKGTSTTLLIVIIVILLLLLLLYVGYQNHQKISSCINGTEGEAGPPPSSNRRGRMKGKYAPLPRSMEETFPRHDD